MQKLDGWGVAGIVVGVGVLLSVFTNWTGGTRVLFLLGTAAGLTALSRMAPRDRI